MQADTVNFIASETLHPSGSLDCRRFGHHSDPAKIISYGFLPMDDALRHAAKTVSGKSWQQILVMRDDFPIDPSPGWQKILEWVHESTVATPNHW